MKANTNKKRTVLGFILALALPFVLALILILSFTLFAYTHNDIGTTETQPIETSRSL